MTTMDPFATSEELEPRPRKGRRFPAAFSGECSGCGDRIDEGEYIRADGSGGYECIDCIEEDA